MMWVESPMKQFEVKPIIPLEIGGVDLSFTNASLYMVIVVALVLGGLAFASSKAAVIPGRVQSVGELIYGFVAKMLRDVIGEEGMKFFPLVFSLFAFVLVANMVGMIPHSFTVTSQIIVTFMLAMLVISVVIIYGVWKNGLKFLKIFAPSGVPAALLPLVALIEVFSFLSRPVSLAVRLFANILAGHIMLKVFAGFVGMMLAGGLVAVLSPLPLALTVAVTALEFLVAFLQAYVFAVLTCVYLNDALHPGH
jgi:F-type H+-transporting ATPase subunit a